MTLRQLDLGRQSNVAWHPHVGVARLVNLHVETAGNEGKVQLPLRAVSGLADFATLSGTGGVARMLATSSSLIVKAGRVIYNVDSEGASAIIGGFPVDGLTTMARNNRPSGDQVAVCGDGLMAIIANGTMTVVDDPDVGVPTSVFELGGYFITTEAGGDARASELLDGTTWDGLSIERIGRDLLIGKPRGRDAVMFGALSTHIWTLNDGAGSMPISPRSTLDYGALAGGGVIEANGTLYWLSTTSQGAYAGVRVLTGDTSQEISSTYVDRDVSRETSPESITGTTWTEDGRTFLAWSGTGLTHVLDLKTGQWHERESLVDGAAWRWRVSQTVQFAGGIVAGDRLSAKLYRLGYAYHDEAGSELVTTLQTPPLTAYPPGRIEVNELHLDVLSGVGLVTGNSQDVTPEIAMRWSADGETWSTELRRALGAAGATGTRVVWRRLGTQGVHGRTYQFLSSAKVARGLLSAAWDGKALPP